MSRIAYLDIIGGISGDMILSAMLDIGINREDLERELTKIVPGQFQLIANKTTRGAITATHLDVRLPDESDHRLDWQDFDNCIETSGLPDHDLDLIRTIFHCLRAAEAEAHNAPEGNTHLHELGSLDTLIDIAGAIIGLRLLGVKSLHASPIPASTGMSASSHGKVASFAPATMAIIKKHQIPVRVSAINPPAGESVTPTGASIIASLAEFNPTTMTVEMFGYGAGTRNTDTPPNVVGLWIGESNDKSSLVERAAANIGVETQSDVMLIETNLDDMTGEETAYAMQMMFDVGAIDVWTTPIQMKKSRPGVILSAIANQQDLALVSNAFFNHTSTLGIRIRQLERLVADREICSVQTEYGPIRVKLRKINGTVTQIAPEYDDCANAATKLGMPIREIEEAARTAFNQTQNPNQHHGD